MTKSTKTTAYVFTSDCATPDEIVERLRSIQIANDLIRRECAVIASANGSRADLYAKAGELVDD